jgi:hypothetical protein
MTPDQTRALALAAARKRKAEAEAAGPGVLESAAGYVSGLAKSAGHGFTLGFMDEIDAGVNAPFIAAKRALVDGQPFDMGRAYDDRLNQYRAGLKEFREDSPVSAFVGEAAGAVGGTLAVPALRAMTSIPAGASMLSQIGRGAATGAALGGAYGYGSGEGGIANRAEGAMTGAAVGGVLGGIAPPLIEGVRKGGQFVADKTINLLPFRQMGAAERKVAEALMRDGMTPEQAAARLRRWDRKRPSWTLGRTSGALRAAPRPCRAKAKPQSRTRLLLGKRACGRRTTCSRAGRRTV